MISKLKAVLDDDRGVSPVIGVILMVAITVILAAVIGTFVLGLGDSLEQAPQSQLSVDATDTTGEVDISHNGGDALDPSNLRVNSPDADTQPTVGTWGDGSGDFGVGEVVTIDFTDTNDQGAERTVQIIHEPSDSIIVEQTVEVPA